MSEIPRSEPAGELPAFRISAKDCNWPIAERKDGQRTEVYMPQTVILSVGLDTHLLEIRNLVLKSAGYTVVTARSAREAIRVFQAGDFDLLLLGHCIPARDRERLAFLVRSFGSHTPVVCVANCSNQADSFADATLDANPKKLLLGLREVLLKAEKRVAAQEATFREKHETGVCR
jgi:DNA-binding response OmpR family regulator